MFFAVSEIPKSVEIQRYLTSIHIDNWIKQDVFLFRWWFLLDSNSLKINKAIISLFRSSYSDLQMLNKSLYNKIFI
ncbi:hypothetical protein Clopa_3733 [Clostridium pasteurianum BC1]|uniref:Uncharacterized protein n=1 Tax=Clostridium pasteurianum BC1 TaxID=86416 RepID=R4KA20_CLOPA|nr:hypothetical protein Clopa_3733 [Clostridium pasteurianum BC1]